MKKSIIFFALVISLHACQKDSGGGDLEPKAFQETIGATAGAVVVDVRTPEEVSGGIIPGAINIDFKNADFKTSIAALDKNKTYFVYCAAGGRSAKAAELMKEQGFQHVFCLAGGMNAWNKDGLETAKP